MNIIKLLEQMVKDDGSDLFYRAGGCPHLRKDGRIVSVGEEILSTADLKKAVEDLTTPEQRGRLEQNLDIDFAFYLKEIDRRFRVSIFHQRNSPSIVVRNIRNQVNNFQELNLPVNVLKGLAQEKRGLVLLTGTMGSGKSTTIASLIDYINMNSRRHILTIEEPIEFVFNDKQSVINQRDLGIDVLSYATALRALTFQSPDVIYLANIRDTETMSAAITAAETGALVLSTLHTVNASQTIERIVNFFPPHQHQQIRVQLSYLLKGVISLRLVPFKDKPGRIPASEVMLLSPTISRLIRESKTWEVNQFLEEGTIFGMHSFSQSLVQLVEQGLVSEEDAINFSDNREEFVLALRGIKKR